MYKAIPHATTGMSPYYLLYGREPRFPVDHLLGVDFDDFDDWVTEHKKRLRAAWTLAESNSEKSAEKRREVHDKKSTPCAIYIGTKVLIRNHVQARNKMQDVWKPEPYIVIEKLQNNVYKVRSLDNYGETKVLHRYERIFPK